MKKFLVAALVAGGVASGGPGAVACHLTNPLNPGCWIHTAAFAGSAGVDCFGCGVSDCNASLTVISAGGVGSASTTECTANEPADVTCVITGTANGHVAGAINVDFNWTRVGATAVITTSGDINGAGVAAFAVTSPVGNPCGQPISADVAGAITGQ